MLIGRKLEKEILHKAMHSGEPEMVAVIGRRRVGKTHLVRTVCEGKIRFEVTGVQNATLKEQLGNFHFQLKKTFEETAPIKQAANWLEAFQHLIICLEKTTAPVEQNVLFFDEVPWLASRKSGFLKGFSFFWNSWADRQNIVLIICGSAASWMIQKVVNDRGGLHNRITRRIDMEPFNLHETEAFLKNRGIHLDRYHLLELYMAMGGIPHYLKAIEAGKSAVQNIQDICFAKKGLLRQEFTRLYPALFDNAQQHIAIVRVLAQRLSGMTRAEIVQTTLLSDGGGLSLCLDELQESGFITNFPAFGKKKKEMVFRLTDEYSLFYLKFIDQLGAHSVESWLEMSQTQSAVSWRGCAFEGVCLKHIAQIKQALGISGIHTEASAFYQKGQDGQPGVQIDLLLDRKDQSINLFELKFYAKPFALTQSAAAALQTKRHLFTQYSQTRKHVFLNLLSTYGLIPNEFSAGLIDHSLHMDILFAPT